LRRRDVVAVCVLFGGVVAGVVWALSTQFRWVRENKPLVPRPAADAEAPEPKQPPAEAPGVVGTVTQDTRDSMARELEARRQAGKLRKTRKPAP
jgi:hypothetical protein